MLCYDEPRMASLQSREIEAYFGLENRYLQGATTLKYPHGAVVGNSAAIGPVLKQAEQVACTDSAVLLLGETGTGKELIANTIHQLSQRRAHRIVKTNCSALPAALIKSELFGREKALSPARSHDRLAGSSLRMGPPSSSMKLVSSRWSCSRSFSVCFRRARKERRRRTMSETSEQYKTRLQTSIAGKDPIAMQREAPRKLASFVEGVSEAKLNQRPSLQKWSVIEIVAHMAEDELVSTWRYRQMLEHDVPELRDFDQNFWAEVGDYASWKLEDALIMFRLLREANLRMFSCLTPEQ